MKQVTDLELRKIWSDALLESTVDRYDGENRISNVLKDKGKSTRNRMMIGNLRFSDFSYLALVGGVMD